MFTAMLSECNDFYSWSNEETSDFTEAWTPIPQSNTTSKNPWQYQTAWDARSFPCMGKMATYSGGGYIVELGPDNVTAELVVDELWDHGWIDRYTRALIAEVSIYNVNVNLLCVITLVYELLPTGGGFHFTNVQTIRLFRYIGTLSAVLLIFELILAMMLFKWIYRDVKNLLKEGKAHCKSVWNVVDLAITGLSVSTVGVYVSRLVFIVSAIKQFHADRSQFVSFQYVVLLNETVNALIAAVVLLLNLKFLRLLRFNRKVSVLSCTIEAARKQLLSFLAMFLVILCAYCFMAYLVLGSVIEEFRTFTRSMVSMMGMMLGDFDFYALEAANRMIGPILFFSFMVIMQFISLNVFVGILCESFSEVRNDSSKQSNEYEIVDFMTNRFKAFLGIFVEPPIRPEYNWPKTRLEENVEAIEEKSETVMHHMRRLCDEDLRQVKWLECDKLTSKKVKILTLVLSTNVLEDDVFDGIPVLSKCSEEQLERVMTASWATRRSNDNSVTEGHFLASESEKEDSEEEGKLEVLVTGERGILPELNGGERNRTILEVLPASDNASFVSFLEEIENEDEETESFQESDDEPMHTLGQDDSTTKDFRSFHECEKTNEAERSEKEKDYPVPVNGEEADGTVNVNSANHVNDEEGMPCVEDLDNDEDLFLMYVCSDEKSEPVPSNSRSYSRSSRVSEGHEN